jgi:hypothetical protein
MARLRRFGHHAQAVAGADLGAVFVVGNIAHLVQPVIDQPGGRGRWRRARWAVTGRRSAK